MSARTFRVDYCEQTRDPRGWGVRYTDGGKRKSAWSKTELTPDTPFTVDDCQTAWPLAPEPAVAVVEDDDPLLIWGSAWFAVGSTPTP